MKTQGKIINRDVTRVRSLFISFIPGKTKKPFLISTEDTASSTKGYLISVTSLKRKKKGKTLRKKPRQISYNGISVEIVLDCDRENEVENIFRN